MGWSSRTQVGIQCNWDFIRHARYFGRRRISWNMQPVGFLTAVLWNLVVSPLSWADHQIGLGFDFSN
jgi:hypothetical protein